MSKRPAQGLSGRTDTAERAKLYLQTISKIPMSKGAMQYAPPLTVSEVVDIAQGIINSPLTPDNSGRYYLPCPGATSHSGGKSARRDCEFMPDGAPTLRCFHSSCEHVLDELNRTIRSACGKAKVKSYTDSTARATKAAEALLIGFNLSADEAQPILNAWAISCTPAIPPLDITSGLRSAAKAYDRASSDSIGCLLAGRPMPTAQPSPLPPTGNHSSVVSAGPAVSKAAKIGVGIEQPIYIGARGRLARDARELIQAFQEDYGRPPKIFLVGANYTGTVPDHIAGLPTQRTNHPDNRVEG